ncbi:hypothetical protein EJB05_29820, partial [Eragrostis curvula]
MHPLPPRSSPHIATTTRVHPSDADVLHGGGAGAGGRSSCAADQRPAVYTILSMRDQWNCYKASEEASDKGSRRQQLFSMRKCSVVQSGDEAEVHMRTTTVPSSDHNNSEQVPSFRVQGSFWRRSCKIRNGDGEEVARITRKKAGAAPESVTLGDDVFSLTVMPNADCPMIMAFVVVMDRICQKPYTPLMCSS